MNLRTLAHALGGNVITGKVLAPGPNHRGHDRSLVVWLDASSPDGFRVHSFAGDNWKVCRDYVRERLGLSKWQPASANMPTLSAPSSVQQVDAQRVDEDRERIDRAMTLWKEAVSLRDTLVERYLERRQLTLPKIVLEADALRFHRSCPFRLDDGSTARLPAMLGLMRDIRTNEPKAVHRTALKQDGSGKAELPGLGNPKKMIGPSKNAVVKLIADVDVIDGLGIAEGIETALTLVCADWRPVWACGSAGEIERFPVLPGIECLTIFADADRAGMSAAEKCQGCWNDDGQECRILAAPNAGADWNDMARVVAA